MKRILALLLITTSLAACSDAQTRQWLNPEKDPDKTFAKLDQPDVDGVDGTMEKMATEATAKGDYQRAGQFYQQLADSKKATPEAKFRYRVGMAESLRRSGKSPAAALDMYKTLAKEQPDNVDVAEGLGLCYMQAGKPTDAGRTFAEIMKKDGKRWRTLNALGILFVNKNMIPEAMAYYTEALNQSPDNPAVLNNVALSQAVDQQYGRAFATFEQAGRVATSEAQRQQISLNMAMVYGISGDLETARTIASKYLQGPALDNNLGLYAHLAKDDGLAKTYLDMALSGSPTYYERAWNNLDVVEQKKEN